MKFGALLAFALALAIMGMTAGLALGAPASRAALHTGNHGQRVKDLQWLLAGHKPSVYDLRTYSGRIDGIFGKQTRDAVRGMKWRLGYPKTAISGRAGKQLTTILLGKQARPVLWIARASKRLRVARVHRVIGGKSVRAAHAIRLAASQLGVHEVPDGSNDSLRIRIYQRVTGAFRAPWCASFQQWIHKRITGKTIPAPLPAYVPSILAWAQGKTLLHALPRAGALVIFLREVYRQPSDGYHIGIVEHVYPNAYTSIEGNYSNAVTRVWHPLGSKLNVFVWLPEYA